MKINSDLIRIQASNYDESGNRLEPEEKLAERILPVDAPVTGSLTGRAFGNLRAAITVQGTVHELATALRSCCAGCKHFDQRAFRTFRESIEFSRNMEKRKILNGIRAALLETGMADVDDANPLAENDVEVQLNSMGLCRALTEVRKDALFVHPEARCPPEYCSASEPDGYYESLNKDVDKVGSAAFDQVMRNAEQ